MSNAGGMPIATGTVAIVPDKKLFGNLMAKFHNGFKKALANLQKSSKPIRVGVELDIAAYKRAVSLYSKITKSMSTRKPVKMAVDIDLNRFSQQYKIVVSKLRQLRNTKINVPVNIKISKASMMSIAAGKMKSLISSWTSRFAGKNKTARVAVKLYSHAGNRMLVRRMEMFLDRLTTKARIKIQFLAPKNPNFNLPKSIKVKVDLDVHKGKLRQITALLKNQGSPAASTGKSKPSSGGGFGGMGGALAGGMLNPINPVTSMAGGVAGLGAAMGFKSALGLSGKFEQSMMDVRATMDLLDKKGQDMFNTLTRKARELGATTKFTAMDAANTFDILAQKGFSAGEALDATEGILNLAAAANIDLANAADIASGALGSYSLAANKIGEVNDIMLSSTVRTAMNINELNEAMKNSANFASRMGIKMSSLTAMIGSMGKSNIKGSRAGTALAIAFQRLSNRTPDVEAALSGLLKRGGKNMDMFFDKAGNIRKGKFEDLMQAIQDGGVQINEMSRIFGARGKDIAAMFSYIDEAGRKGMAGVKALTTSIEGDVGRAAKMAKAKNDTFIGSMLELDSATEELQISLGNYMSKAVRPMINQLTVVIRRVAAWNEETGGMAAKLILATSAAVGFGTAVYLLSPAITSVLTAFSGIKAMVAAVATLANPILLIVAAVTAAAFAYVMWKDQIAGTLKSLYETSPIIKTIVDSLAWLGSKAMEVWSAIQSYAVESFNAILPIVKMVTGYVLNRLTQVFEIGKTIWNAQLQIVKMVFGAIYSVVKGVFDFINSVITDNWHHFEEWAININDIYRSILDNVNAVVGMIMKVWSDSVKYMIGIIFKLGKFANDTFFSIFGVSIQNALKSGIGYVFGFISDILNFVSLLSQDWKSTWQLMADYTMIALEDVLAFATDTFRKIAKMMANSHQTAVSFIVKQMLWATSKNKEEYEQRLQSHQEDVQARGSKRDKFIDETANNIIGASKKRRDERQGRVDKTWANLVEKRNQSRKDDKDKAGDWFKKKDVKIELDGPVKIEDPKNPNATLPPRSDVGPEGEDTAESGTADKKKSEVVGLSEMHAKIQTSIGESGPANQTAKNTAEMVKQLRELNRKKNEAKMAKAGAKNLMDQGKKILTSKPVQMAGNNARNGLMAGGVMGGIVSGGASLLGSAMPGLAGVLKDPGSLTSMFGGVKMPMTRSGKRNPKTFTKEERAANRKKMQERERRKKGIGINIDDTPGGSLFGTGGEAIAQIPSAGFGSGLMSNAVPSGISNGTQTSSSTTMMDKYLERLVGLTGEGNAKTDVLTNEVKKLETGLA